MATKHTMIKCNKIKLQKILGADFKHILDSVYQNSLITDYEFNSLMNLKDINSLVDKIMGKGEGTCKAFLDLLQTADIQGTFPDLKEMELKDPLKRGLDDPNQENHDGPVQSKRHMGDDQDKLTSNPKGLCVNINTFNIMSHDAQSVLQPGRFRKVDAMKHSQMENFRRVLPPHDDSDDTATGFLHCVTQIKRSKSTQVKYFNAVLQTGPDEFHQTVIFAPEKHTDFTQAQVDSTPVKLSRIKKQWCPDFSGDSFEVVVSGRSDMDETTVPFEPKQPTDSAKMKIVEVLKLEPKKKIGKLHAHVTEIKDAIEIVKLRGEDLEVKECWVCDSTERIQLQLWDDLIKNVKLNTSYEFSNISTRQKAKETQLYLTCTKHTGITPIPNLVVPKHLTVKSVDENLISISGEISGIDLINNRRCSKPYCGKSQMVMNTQSEYHKCEGCSLKRCVSSSHQMCLV